MLILSFRVLWVLYHIKQSVQGYTPERSAVNRQTNKKSITNINTISYYQQILLQLYLIKNTKKATPTLI